MSQLQENINKIQKELIFYLIIIQLVMTVLVLVIFIFLTHKIAGPLYKLKNHLFKIRTGSPITPLTFREGDYFHDVAEEVSLFLETVKSNQETDFENIDDIATYLKNLSSVVPDDKRPVLDEIHRRLIQVQKRYQEDV